MNNDTLLTLLFLIVIILFAYGGAILWLLGDIKDELKQVNNQIKSLKDGQRKY